MLPVQMTNDGFISNENSWDKSVNAAHSAEGARFKEIFESAKEIYESAKVIQESARVNLNSPSVQQKEDKGIDVDKTENAEKTAGEMAGNFKVRKSDNDSSKTATDPQDTGTPVKNKKGKKTLSFNKEKPQTQNVLKEGAVKTKENGKLRIIPFNSGKKVPEVEDPGPTERISLKDQNKEAREPGLGKEPGILSIINLQSDNSAGHNSMAVSSDLELKPGSGKEKSSAAGNIARNTVKNLGKAGIKKGSGTKSGAGESLKKHGTISVLDLREQLKATSRAKQAGTLSDNESQKLSNELAEKNDNVKADDVKPIVVEVTHLKDNFSGESKTLNATTGSALMKQLEESINDKLVKQSSIILKGSDSGEIKLILKPDQLGQVRIRVNLTDNRITGQIYVENASVKEIFEENLQNLEKAFKENGFTSASLNVSVGGRGNSQNSRDNAEFARKIERIEDIIPAAVEQSDNIIDLVV